MHVDDVCEEAPPLLAPLQPKSGKTEEGGDDAAKGAVGSGVRRFVDTSVKGKFGLGHPSRRRVCELVKFFSTPDVPKPANGVKPEDVDLSDPGPHVCPVVWCSLSNNPEAFCTARGKPGHGVGGTAHRPKKGWREKYVQGLMWKSQEVLHC